MAAFSNFYRCEICKNTTTKIIDGGGRMVCCGQPMILLIAGSVDASHEKHVPVITRDGLKVIVEVGAAEHPSLPEHYIQWIQICDGVRTQRVDLNPGDKPRAEFYTDSDRLVTAYEYCNLHGLWKAEE